MVAPPARYTTLRKDLEIERSEMTQGHFHCELSLAVAAQERFADVVALPAHYTTLRKDLEIERLEMTQGQDHLR